MLMVVCVGMVQIADAPTYEEMHLNEEKVIPKVSAPDT